MKKDSLLTVLFILLSFISMAQVPVREEPRHKPVLQNKYIRLLDVWLSPGDTTLYHVHATPSLFVVLTDAHTISQVKGGSWAPDQWAPGKTWYRSFINDTFVHRVANIDTVSFHVNDIEILSSFDASAHKSPLPFQVVLDNEKAIAYHLKGTSLNNHVINGRGPIIAELIKGKVQFHNQNAKTATPIQAGKYLYIPPGSSFYFFPLGKDEISMIVFEIR